MSPRYNIHQTNCSWSRVYRVSLPWTLRHLLQWTSARSYLPYRIFFKSLWRPLWSRGVWYVHLPIYYLLRKLTNEKCPDTYQLLPSFIKVVLILLQTVSSVQIHVLKIARNAFLGQECVLNASRDLRAMSVKLVSLIISFKSVIRFICLYNKWETILKWRK